MASVEFIGNLRASSRWLNELTDRDRGVQPTPVKLDASQFTDTMGVTVITSGATAGATSVPVTALTPNSALANTTLIAAGGVLIPNGTTLYFGGAKVATLTADAKIGDTALTVAAIPTTLAASDTATFSRYGGKFIPSGTIIGRTYAEAQANTPYGPAVSTDDEIYPIVFDVPDATRNNDAEIVRRWATIRENYLPGYGATGPLGTSASPSALLTKLRTLFVCEQGTN